MANVYKHLTTNVLLFYISNLFALATMMKIQMVQFLSPAFHILALLSFLHLSGSLATLSLSLSLSLFSSKLPWQYDAHMPRGSVSSCRPTPHPRLMFKTTAAALKLNTV